jgi:hypothetical protein
MEYGTMTQQPDMATCNGCCEKMAAKEINGINLCTECAALAVALNENPLLLKRISSLMQPDSTSEESSDAKQIEPPQPRELPEVLDAVRFRTRDREMNTWYVSISELEGNPVEIFASTAFDRDQHLQSRISNLTTITRLISLILRHVFLGEVITLEKTLKQLHRSSRQKNDLPDMLTRVLCTYSKKPYEFDS